MEHYAVHGIQTDYLFLYDGLEEFDIDTSEMQHEYR